MFHCYSFNLLNQPCVSHTTINSNSDKINESAEMRDQKENSNFNCTTIATHQDDSINSSNELVDKNNSSYNNVSTFSITPLKRSNSATVSPSDQFVGGIDPPNELIKDNSSITEENGYPAAKKSKL